MRAKVALVALLAALWLVVVAPAAAAHADLTATEPAAGEVLERSPSEIVLRFSEGVDPIAGGIRLVRDNGEEVGRFDIEHNEGSVLRVELGQVLEPAAYVVAWRAVSADSHPIRGAFVFHVGPGSGSGLAADTSALVSRLLADQGGTPGTGAVLAAGRWLSFVGVLIVVGALLIVLWGPVLGGPARWDGLIDAGRSVDPLDAEDGAERVDGGSDGDSWWRLRRLVVVAAGLGVAGSVLMIAAQAVSVSGNWRDVVDVRAWWEVASTRSGRWWVARLVLLVLALVGGGLAGRGQAHPPTAHGAFFAGTRPRPARWWGGWSSLVGVGIAATAVGLALVTALGGHAVSGRWVALGVAATVVHLLALGFWMTGVVLLVSLWRGGSEAQPLSLAVARAFSPWALAVVVVVVATGAFNSVRQVGDVSLLTSTDYGTVLVVKVVLVAGLIGVAALSRRALHRAVVATPADTAPVNGAARTPGRSVPSPGLAGSAARGSLRRTVMFEALVFAGVLVASAVLVNIRPAYSERSGPTTGSDTVGQRLVQVVLEPARAGSNALHVYLSSPGGALDRADPITVTATLAEADLGPIDVEVFPAGPNHVTSPSVDLPLKGRWSFEVTARYGRFEEVRFTVPLTVSG